ncbi:hypothetical protein [Desulfonema magnum]|uniref:Uncharacterized protein n=1 Tax=Desulfonema magnum TaxID=45655 RepID=A0A975GSB9_9BACT|nr:hypothetical protein [Desulfonema magnum]QTA91752.1 Uncharacterized protein dnm_078260 [Desulfonema magnum]
MTDEKISPDVEFTPEFKRNLRSLAKKYRHIRSDIQPVIDQIQKGDFVGDQIPKTVVNGGFRFASPTLQICTD